MYTVEALIKFLQSQEPDRFVVLMQDPKTGRSEHIESLVQWNQEDTFGRKAIVLWPRKEEVAE